MTNSEVKDYFIKHPSMLGVFDKVLYIKNATDIGFLVADVFDGIDLSYMNFNTRRGRVQKGMSQTITCNANLGVVVYGD